ncbi:MAG: type I restriction enzyme HsdR N-terminal domain-containing protein [Chloroflexota bacterium]|nr:type I restriction enzyme HsdR N-terminal domain-containing protein [Chloroflexota bacterium]
MPNQKPLINEETLGELEVIPSGKLKCFITGNLRNDKPEERIRQDVARSLVEEYGYDKNNIELEFPIKMGREKKRADIVTFLENRRHDQENVYMIVEAKTENIKPSDRKEGIDQLESYVAACPNATFALWVGNERLAFKVAEERGKKVLTQIPDIPKAGEVSASAYQA